MFFSVNRVSLGQPPLQQNLVDEWEELHVSWNSSQSYLSERVTIWTSEQYLIVYLLCEALVLLCMWVMFSFENGSHGIYNSR